jgi:hypothetical protein
MQVAGAGAGFAVQRRQELRIFEDISSQVNSATLRIVGGAVTRVRGSGRPAL